MQTFEWAIEDIVVAHPGLYLEHHAVIAVALMSRVSHSPCDFLVECEGFSPAALKGDKNFLLRVSWDGWTEIRAERIWRSEQPKPIVERAAVAIAILQFAHLMPGGPVRVTKEGERADYWLTHLECALEVSGTEQSGELPRRQREKTVQLLGNPRGWNGYVCVCGFTATNRRVRWSYHTQEKVHVASS